MIGVSLLAAGVFGQANLFPVGAPYRSRAEFRKLSYKIKSGYTKAQIIEILGTPDVVEKDGKFRSYEILLYGVDPSTGVPTLEQYFAENKPVKPDPSFLIRSDNRNVPPTQKMDEQEIRSLIVALTDEIIDEDPLRFIRIANRLIALGDKKARYVLYEYECANPFRYAYYGWLLYFLFPYKEVPTALDAIKSDAIRFLSPDIPILAEPRFLTSTGPDFRILWRRRLPIRSHPLVPQHDPFKLASLEADRDRFLPQLKYLVRGAVQFAEDDKNRSFDSYYLQFLRSGAKWSEPLQNYVKGDGTVLPEPDSIRYRRRINTSINP